MVLANLFTDGRADALTLHDHEAVRDAGARLAVDSLRRQTAMVDPRVDMCFAKSLIDELGPTGAHGFVLVRTCKQTALRSRGVAKLHARLCAEPSSRDFPGRREQVSMVRAGIPALAWRMYSHVDGYVVAVRQIPRECSSELPSLLI